jgi:hypothetical protein
MSTMHRASAVFVFLTFLPSLSAKSPQVLAEFAIFPDGDALLLPVQFGGKRHLFLLDTGATNTIYDSTFRARLGDPIDKVSVETSGGPVELPIFQAPEASVGKMSLRTQESVVCADLKSVREVSGHQVMGVVGLDFLRQHRIRIDFDASKLQFLDSLEEEPGVSIPLMHRRYYFAKGSVPGQEEEFMVDTGMGGYGSGLLEVKLCERLMQARKIKNVSKDRFVAAAGNSEGHTLALNDFDLGPFTHRRLYFGTAPRSILGLGYLSRYIVTLDFPNQRMYLKKSKRFDQPDSRDLSGLHILRVDGQTVVKFVDSGSPAARAVIEPKDILLKVDNFDGTKTRMHVLRQRLECENEAVRLRFRREDEEREVVLKLSK